MHSIQETDKNNLFFCTCNNDEISALIIVLMLAVFPPFFTTNIFIYVQHFVFMYNTLYLCTTLYIYVQNFICRKTSFSSQNYFYEYSIFFINY